MIAEIAEGQLRARDTLLEALSLIDIRGNLEAAGDRNAGYGKPKTAAAEKCGICRKPRIAAVGAGGKTTLLKRLAREYLALGQQSVIITTTHMKKEDTAHFLVDPSAEEILKVREREGYVIAGADANAEKIKIFPRDVLEAVLDFSCPVLIEADGARMLPVKIPAEYEPVLLPQVTCVLAVYGLDSLGRKIRDVGFRAEQMAEFLRKDPEDRLEARDIAALALSRRGGRKCVTEDMQYRVVLSKADTEERRQMAIEVWRAMERINPSETCRIPIFLL